MDFSKIYDVYIYANSTTDKIFVEQIIEATKNKVTVNELWYYDEGQVPLVEQALNSWRSKPSDTKFTWPFIAYRHKDSIGNEFNVFIEGQDAITEFANS